MKTRHTTLSELESHLWESANILRGPVDAADFKTYIFPLLFFKRIYDPACGTGGMLLAAVQHVKETHGGVKRLSDAHYRFRSLRTAVVAQ